MRKISNLHDLASEKQRLQQKLTLLKRDVNNEVLDIKEKLKPVGELISFFTNESSNGKKNSIWKQGANMGIDLLVGPKIAKAGWLARLLLPPLLRGISSKVIDRVKK